MNIAIPIPIGIQTLLFHFRSKPKKIKFHILRVRTILFLWRLSRRIYSNTVERSCSHRRQSRCIYVYVGMDGWMDDGIV